MSEVIRFALLGLGLGALYSLAAQGLMLIYRGSGVLNFAHGAIGMVAAYLCWDMSVNAGVPYPVAFVVGVLVSAAIGALTHLLVMRPLRRASALTRIAATLGVLILIQGLVVLYYGSDVVTVDSQLPTTIWPISGDISITADRVILVTIAALLSLGLWAAYRFSRFGLATSAVAENERIAASLGWSPDRIAAANWALGSALAGAAAILIAPIVQLQPITMTNLVIAALAPALIAGFRSFPVVFFAAIGVGIVQTEVTRYTTVPGLGNSVPFIAIILVMILRGQSLPARNFALQSLPRVGTGRVRPGLVVLSFLLAAALLLVVGPEWQEAFTITLAFAVILQSVLLLTGYTGQISLAQYTVAGLGAWVTARMDISFGMPFLLAMVIGVVVSAPIGALFALPAARARGLSLAVATLGMGATIELMVFNNPSLTGGAAGMDVSTPSVFGFSLEPILDPGRYAVFALVMFALVGLAVANLRRGRSGRRMLAVRTNERAAAALGISVSQTKVYAFSLAATVAAVGGILMAYRNDIVTFSDFTNFTSISLVAFAMVGGVGYILGSVFGAQLAPSALGTQIGNALFSDVTAYVAPVGGLIVILLLLQNQDGLTKQNIDQFRSLGKRLGWWFKPDRSSVESGVLGEAGSTFSAMTPKTLEVRDVTVKFGAVVAVDSLSLSISPSRITGLIGPNGAGKTTAIDAITGFVRATSGTLELAGNDITGLSASARARVGVSRSFQSLELFEDMTVLDNLRTAADDRDLTALAVDLLRPVNPPLPEAAQAAVRAFELEDDLDRLVSDLPLGRRRLVAIARAVASQPSVLLLDEPAAGLGDRESMELAGLVRRLADEAGLAVLLVEHDMNFVMSVCDEIVVLDFGRTIARGTPEEVRRDPATIKAYLGDDDADVDQADEPSITIGPVAVPASSGGAEPEPVLLKGVDR